MSCEELKYFLPVIGALLGVFVGAWLAPYIEKRKSNFEAKKALSVFYHELNSYHSDLKKFIGYFYDGYKKSKKLELGVTLKLEDVLPLNFPRHIEFWSIELVKENAFLLLNLDQLKALTALTKLAEEFNLFTEKLGADNTNLEKIKVKANDFEQATQISASLYYLVNELVTNKNKFKYEDLDTFQYCQNILSELNIRFDVESILGKGEI